MRRFLKKMFKSQSGQGMSEYLIIVALIAIAAIGVVTVFGRDIRALFSDTTNSLAGNTQNNNSAVHANVKTTKSLKNFGAYKAASGD
jgi:pilus assembly protein Flp/PilA